MGTLQPGLPHPSAIPKNTFKIVFDLKDCFYTIPLSPPDYKQFTFSVPNTNFQKPIKRYHWLVLPQDMANSPTLCQKFVSEAIQKTRHKHPKVYIIHYINNILLAHFHKGELLACYAELKKKTYKPQS